MEDETLVDILNFPNLTKKILCLIITSFETSSGGPHTETYGVRFDNPIY